MKNDSRQSSSKLRWPLTRRGFLTSLGTGAAAVAASGSLLAATGGGETPPIAASDGAAVITLTVNGRAHQVMVEPRWTLLYVLREKIGLTGPKEGCGRGECGACTVLMDGVARYACLTLAVEAVGHEITTLEGLLQGEELGTVQQAFVEHDAYQCGYCTPGQVMAVEGLLRANPSPDLEQIRVGVSGNLCRCGAYANIFRAAQAAAATGRDAAAGKPRGGQS